MYRRNYRNGKSRKRKRAVDRDGETEREGGAEREGEREVEKKSSANFQIKFLTENKSEGMIHPVDVFIYSFIPFPSSPSFALQGVSERSSMMGSPC